MLSHRYGISVYVVLWTGCCALWKKETGDPPRSCQYESSIVGPQEMTYDRPQVSCWIKDIPDYVVPCMFSARASRWRCRQSDGALWRSQEKGEVVNVLGFGALVGRC
jgi:hypothetical protein